MTHFESDVKLGRGRQVPNRCSLPALLAFDCFVCVVDFFVCLLPESLFWRILVQILSWSFVQGFVQRAVCVQQHKPVKRHSSSKESTKNVGAFKASKLLQLPPES